LRVKQTVAQETLKCYHVVEYARDDDWDALHGTDLLLDVVVACERLEQLHRLVDGLFVLSVAAEDVG
jgi:hypothetical protein